MAEVLEAVAVGDHGFERRVAIKRLHASDSAEATMYGRMFLDEARIAAQLHHANIVAVLDYGVADGRPFQVLEHVDGLDVRALCNPHGRSLPVDLALYICSLVGHALEYAHAEVDARGNSLGIVHRDVTPGNILVAWSGDVKLTDFGIAFAHERAEQTLAGITKGTPHYMSPEQQLADPVDGRADLFSLGCVLHWMIAGWSPLARVDDMYLMSEGNEVALDVALPDDVRTIIARATRHAPDARYANASEFAAAITMALAKRGAFDPRSALRAWMRELQGEAAAATTAEVVTHGQLDELPEGELVFEHATDDARVFTSAANATRPDRPAVKVEKPAAVVEQAPVEQAPVRAMPAPAPASRRKMFATLAALALALVVAVWLGSVRGDKSDRTVHRDEAPSTPPPTPAPVAAPEIATAMAVAPTLELGSGTSSEAAKPSTASKRAPVAATSGAHPRAGSAAPTPRAAPPVELAPSGEAADTSALMQRWSKHHPHLVRAFTDWVASHPTGATALHQWSQRTHADQQLVEWLRANPSGTYDLLLAAQRGTALAAILVANRADLEAFLEMSRTYPTQFGSLADRSLGLPWTATVAER